MAVTSLNSFETALPQDQRIKKLLNAAVVHHQNSRFAEAASLYKEVCGIEPDNHLALQLLGVLAAQTGQMESSLKLLSKAISLSPNYAEALSNRGNVLQKLGRLDEAIADYSKAISLKPNYIDALYNRGIALKELKRFDEAVADYNKAIALKPDHVEALNNRGNVMQQLGRFDEALKDFNKALSLKPDHVEALNSRGFALGILRRFDEALDDYDKALTLKPEYADAYINRSSALIELKRYDEALKDCNKAISLKPDCINAFYNRGIALKDLKLFEGAIADYSKVISLKPDHVGALNNRGNALRQLRRWDEAFQDFEKAISLRDDYSEAFNNRGVTQKDLKHYEEAVADYSKAISLKPDYVEALNNRGVVLGILRRFDEALDDYDKALTLKPDHIDVNFHKSLQLLRQGEFALGWKLYEWRWKATALSSPLRKFEQPLWLGKEDLGGKTILLHWEQGFGDTIQFSRYAAEVSKFGCKTILEVQKPLFELMKTIKGVDEVIVSGTDLPSFDFYCPLMSLPLAMGTTLETIPSGGPYLKSADDKLAKWSARLGQKSKPRVGIVWSGSVGHKNDHNRSIALEDMLSSVPDGYELVSLQKEVRDIDLNTMVQSKQLRHFGSDLNDFTDTAALCELMDVIVSVDTSVAHLAGAIGKPVNLLLPYDSDFRWLLDRHDSPWYPTMKLFTQGPDMTWDSVFEKINTDLKFYFYVSLLSLREFGGKHLHQEKIL